MVNFKWQAGQLISPDVVIDNLYAKITALLIVIISELTDYFDGKIARSRKQVTNTGKILDPLAVPTLNKNITKNNEGYGINNVDGNTSEILAYDPLGVIANISAWNYPYLVVINIFVLFFCNILLLHILHICNVLQHLIYW